MGQSSRSDFTVFGMAIEGEEGVRHVMRSLLAAFDILMNCVGANSIKDIIKDRLRKSSPTHYDEST